ncbi:O-antigen ligase family protein [Peribacillus frigoritolerans]|uniref:O-antigen ligase family protein n=1 Tax=Peribacillus frigoritolerans TaxID=450367 RepID=UPI0039A17664
MNIRMNNIKNNKYALLVALMITIQFINEVIVEIIGNEVSVMPALFVLLFLYYIFISLRHGVLNFKISYIIIGLLISTYYCISYLLYSDVISVSLTFFFGFCFMPYLFMYKQVDTKLVITYVVKISVIAIPVVNGIFNYSQSGVLYNSIPMGMAYAILPVIISSFVHFIYYRKSSTLWVKIAYVANLYYLVKLLSLGNRGIILSLIFALILVYLIRFDKNGHRIFKNSYLFITQIIIVSLTVGIIIVNFQQFFIIIYNKLNAFGINPAFLSKTNFLLANGNVDNGRIELISLGLNGFIKSPLWGNGIGVFGVNNTLGLYPHNLFVQLLYDGGLILTVPIVYLLLSCTIRIFKTTQLNQGFPLFILLFSTSIPRLMVSADIWKVQTFWMLLAFVIVNFSSHMTVDSGKDKEI